MQNIKGKTGRYVINQADCYWSLLCECEDGVGRNRLKSSQIQNKRAVYIFFDWNDKPIRIGKSVQVRNRLLSYANRPQDYDLFEKMQDDIQFVGVIYTNDELESLSIELDLLQQYKPIHNHREG